MVSVRAVCSVHYTPTVTTSSWYLLAAVQIAQDCSVLPPPAWESDTCHSDTVSGCSEGIGEWVGVVETETAAGCWTQSHADGGGNLPSDKSVHH